MQLSRYEPWALLNRLHHEAGDSDLFDALRPKHSLFERELDGRYWQPAVDVKEEANQYVIHADIPGVDPKDIEITADKGTLTVKAERSSVNEESKDHYRRIERVQGTYYRRFQLPKDADVDAIEATGKNGVLELVLPKKAEEQVKKISVKH